MPGLAKQKWQLGQGASRDHRLLGTNGGSTTPDVSVAESSQRMKMVAENDVNAHQGGTFSTDPTTLNASTI